MDGSRNSGSRTPRHGRTLVLLDRSERGMGLATALARTPAFGPAVREWTAGTARTMAAWADGDGPARSEWAGSVADLATRAMARAFTDGTLVTELLVATDDASRGMLESAASARCMHQRCRELDVACPDGCVGICLTPEDGTTSTTVVDARSLEARMRAEARARDGWIEGMADEEMEHARRTLHAESSARRGGDASTHACMAAAWMTLRQPGAVGDAVRAGMSEVTGMGGPAWVNAAVSADGDWVAMVARCAMDVSPGLRWNGLEGRVEREARTGAGYDGGRGWP